MKLTEIVPWGRSLAEYQAMFALTKADLDKPILGVGDGPASVNAELSAQGGQIISIDPIYAFSADEIQQRVAQTYETVIRQVRQQADRYVWTVFRDADELGKHRLRAMEQFLTDYPEGLKAGRYVPLSLPDLGTLPTGSVGLALVSHLLFLYSKQLSQLFHIQSVMELLRVANEARIFPLLTLTGDKSPYVDPVIEHVTRAGFTVELPLVNYEFQKGSNQMMLIRRSL
jgi:hypothetical protein